MSARAIQTLLLAALTDRRREVALLDGCLSAYDGFELSSEEIKTLSSIQHETLAAYAAQAHLLLYDEVVPPVAETLAVAPYVAQPESQCA